MDTTPDSTDGEQPRAPAAGPSAPDPPDAPWWLLRHRVTVPDPAPGLLERPALAGRAAVTARRLTLLLAPGGFGKTTLLAECCRMAARDGARIAWLSLEDDEPGALDTYLAFAFQHAGVEVDANLLARAPDADLPHRRTTLLLRALEAAETPCVLALDEAERVTDPGAVALLDFIVRAAPPSLHLAVACRELPAGFDIAGPVTDDEGALITARDLRFNDREIAALCGASPTRARIAAVAAASDRWPVAVRLQCNADPQEGPTAGPSAMRHVTGEWVGARLWPTLDEADARLLLAVGQFDWFDEALLADALGEPHAMARVTGMQQLDGLLCPTRVGDARVLTLHPLVREHCVRALRRDDPVRHGEVHRGIAGALAQRSVTVDAMRHATEAGDGALAAQMLLEAGGLRLALRDGFDRLGVATRMVSTEAARREPRLTLAACAADAASGRLAQARRALAQVSPTSPEGLSGAALELSADRCLARIIVANYGCESALTAETLRLHENLRQLAAHPDVEPLVHATMDYARCVAFTVHAVFDRARDYGDRVLQRAHGAPLLTASVHLHAGQAAMAQGLVADAVSRYGRGGDIARRSFLQEPLLALAASVFSRELDLERHRAAAVGPEGLPPDVYNGFGLDACIAATDLALEHAHIVGGPLAAIRALDEASRPIPEGDLPGLRRHLAASRVRLLAEAGQAVEARDTWEVQGLPRSDDECVEVVTQGWREVESVSCARMRLLAVSGDGAAALRLADALIKASTERGLCRTVMRARALGVSLAYAAGQQKAAHEHLARYLDLYAETDYAHCLLRERGVEEVLAEFVDAEPSGPRQDAAAYLLSLARPDAGAPRLTARERDVLMRLENERDGHIAAALGLSRPGVRYHVQKLFAKLGVRKRRDAVRRARELGLLQPWE